MAECLPGSLFCLHYYTPLCTSPIHLSPFIPCAFPHSFSQLSYPYSLSPWLLISVSFPSAPSSSRLLTPCLCSLALSDHTPGSSAHPYSQVLPALLGSQCPLPNHVVTPGLLLLFLSLSFPPLCPNLTWKLQKQSTHPTRARCPTSLLTLLVH